MPLATANPDSQQRTGPLGRRAATNRRSRGSGVSSQARTFPVMLSEILVLIWVVSLFIPGAISHQVGIITLTPTFAVSMLLFPLLLFGARLRWVWPDLLVIGLFCSYFISSVMSTTPERAIETMGRLMLISLVPYMAGRFVMQDIKRMTRTLGLMLTLLAVMATASLLESFFRFNIHSELWNVPYRPHKQSRMGLTRAHGWTTHAIMFGLVNAVFLPIILVIAKEKLTFMGRWPWLKFFAISLGCFLSFSTGAWGPAALAVMFVVWDYYAPFHHKTLWPITFGTLIGGYVLLEGLANRPLLRILMMELHLSSPDAWYYRWRLYDRVYSVMPGHWWFGHGLALPDSFLGFQSSVDNNFLLVLLVNGRVGLCLWIAVAISVIVFGGKAVWATSKPTRLVHITRAMCFSLIGMLLTQLSVALFSTPASLYWMMMGLIIGATLMCQSEQREIAAKRVRAKRLRAQHATQAGEPRSHLPAERSHLSSGYAPIKKRSR